MKITNIEFSDTETVALYALAGATLREQGMGRKEAMALIESLTPQNIVRLALGIERRQRGGARPNTGRRRAEEKKRPRGHTAKPTLVRPEVETGAPTDIKSEPKPKRRRSK